MYRLLFLCTLLVLTGCSNNRKVDPAAEKLPVFSLATSEYPSWSTFVVAAKAGLINGKEGEYGELEKKWGVDIVLHVKDYDPCLTMYGAGTVDAVCMTNMDALNPALSRASTAICPTSTSDGADKIIAAYKNDQIPIDQKPLGFEYLKGTKVYGLSKSVSEYLHYRACEKFKVSPANFPFVNLEPSAAATALQTGSKDVRAICVWNPFALQTLRTQKNATVIVDSKIIPEEIIDMVVVANASLAKDKGNAFAHCVLEAFYEVNKRMAAPATSDATYKALGAEFSNLGVEDMKLCCKETKFYETPKQGIDLFDGDKLPGTMKRVVSTCQSIGVLEVKTPTIGYNDSKTQLNFTSQYMKKLVK